MCFWTPIVYDDASGGCVLIGGGKDRGVRRGGFSGCLMAGCWQRQGHIDISPRLMGAEACNPARRLHVGCCAAACSKDDVFTQTLPSSGSKLLPNTKLAWGGKCSPQSLPALLSIHNHKASLLEGFLHSIHFSFACKTCGNSGRLAWKFKFLY